MSRLLLPAVLLIASSGCIFVKDRGYDEEDDWSDDDEECWEERCDDEGRPGDRPGADDTAVGGDDDGRDTGDDTMTPAEFGVYLTPDAAPQNSTFIASLFALDGYNLEDIAWIDFVARDSEAVLPTIVAQQARSPWERVLAINVPAQATVGTIDAYITFTDDDYLVIERIFEVLPEGEEIGPWIPPEEPFEDDTDA